MRRWLVGAIPVSVWLSWMAWEGPPAPQQYTTPPPLVRPVSATAKLAVLKQATDITDLIQQSQRTRGHAIPTSLLEAVDKDGVPYIEQPIPDNTLMPGIASIEEHCPAEDQMSQRDWVYCPTTGVLRAVIDGQSVSGKE